MWHRFTWSLLLVKKIDDLIAKPPKLEKVEVSNIKSHKTNFSAYSSISVEEILLIIRDNMLSKNQKIYVNSKTSILSKHFDAYWK